MSVRSTFDRVIIHTIFNNAKKSGYIEKNSDFKNCKQKNLTAAMFETRLNIFFYQRNEFMREAN